MDVKRRIEVIVKMQKKCENAKKKVGGMLNEELKLL